jgi:hypothetical protein
MITSVVRCKNKLVDLTTTQVETLFGELEYIDPQLRVLDIAEEGHEISHINP